MAIIITLENLINELLTVSGWLGCVAIEQAHDHLVFTLILWLRLGRFGEWSYLTVSLDLLDQLLNFVSL
jgi:hypothetical protein